MAINAWDIAVAAGGLAVIALIVGLWALAAGSRTRRRWDKLIGSHRPEGWETLLATLNQDVGTLQDHLAALTERVGQLETRGRAVLNRVGLVRFNPFLDTGSDLSFSLAMLNDEGDGVVITSLWARDEVRLYAKPVERQGSRYTLSQEEKQAIDMAMNVRQPKA